MKEHSIKCKKRPCTCDGYHTFEELYEHRMVLFIALGSRTQELLEENITWRSKLHSDGTMFEGGWFILGINTKKGKQVTYHLPIRFWEETKFAKTLERAPKWDGHTSDDVLKRLKKGV